MAQQVTIEIYTGSTRVGSLAKMVADLPFTPYASCAVVLAPPHPRLGGISATVLVGYHPTIKDGHVMLKLNTQVNMWHSIVSHFLDHGWEKIEITTETT